MERENDNLIAPVVLPVAAGEIDSRMLLGCQESHLAGER